RFAAGLSRITDLPAGVCIAPLAQVMAGDPERLEQVLGQADQGGSPLALNLALAADGVFLEIAAGVSLLEPLHVVHVASSPLAASFPRHVALLGQGAQAVLVEHYVGTSESATLTNAALLGYIQRDARLTHLKLQQE